MIQQDAGLEDPLGVSRSIDQVIIHRHDRNDVLDSSSSAIPFLFDREDSTRATVDNGGPRVGGRIMVKREISEEKRWTARGAVEGATRRIHGNQNIHSSSFEQ